GNAAVSSDGIREQQLKALNQESIKHEFSLGKGAQALQNQAAIERLYQVPYLAHAAMEPVNATALRKADGTLEVWAGSQDSLGARAFCAKTAGVRPEAGCFLQIPSCGALAAGPPG